MAVLTLSWRAAAISRLGGQAGTSLGRYEVALRAGILRDMTGRSPMFPLYATLAVATNW